MIIKRTIKLDVQNQQNASVESTSKCKISQSFYKTLVWC